VPLLFRIQPSSPQPAYAQIVDAIQKAVRDGKVEQGERLPSIRALAADLAINPNTVARAYRELEWLGLIRSRLGSGFEVCGETSNAEEVSRKLSEAVKDGVKVLGEEETMRTVREAIRETRAGREEGSHGKRR
jgi:GntR family transcriptional regulator